MSILLKKPTIESVCEALGDDGKAAFLDIVNSSGPYEKCDLDKGPLPSDDAPSVKRVLLSHAGDEYSGAYAKTSLGAFFVEFMDTDKCRIWSVDEKARAMEKVAEPLDADELRRVLGGSSGGGGSGLPEDYATSLQELIQFSGNKAEIGGDLEVDGKASVNSLPAGFGGDFVFAKLPIYLVDGDSDVDLGITMPVLLFHNNATAKYPGVEDASINSKYIMALTCGQMTVEAPDMSKSIEFSTRFVPVYKNRNTPAESVEEALKGFISIASLTSNIPVQYDDDLRQLLKMTGDAVDDLYIDRMEVVNLDASLNSGNISGDVTVSNNLTLTESLAKKSSAKYQHTVTLRTPTSATDLFCFTAMSSKSTPIDSYQDLTEVFGGCTVAGYGLDKTSKLAFTKLNLHGGTIATDSLTDGEESRTLASFQTVTFADDVCVPK